MKVKSGKGIIILFILFLFTGYLRSECNTIWIQRYDGGWDDSAQGIAVDDNGYVYVTGGSYMDYPGSFERGVKALIVEKINNNKEELR